ncbi:MAG: RsmE family RNA methyltransferase [Candidatus Omnitrophica bacterium]|nr:RsmE family RNA methyltransferase [Candidatus Omnitrophota bacterium]
MNRFFITKIKKSGQQIILDDPEQLHHLRDVLRVKISEKISLFDNSGTEYLALVKNIGPGSASLELIEERHNDDLGVKITVACAIPKNAKFDEIIDKLTQLGVECIIPLETERVIVKLNKHKRSNRLLRWDKIAISAAKQSKRSKLPIIKPISEFKDIVSKTGDFDLKLIPTLEGDRKYLREIFNTPNKKIGKVIVLIGPEGDFSPAEITLAKDSGFLPVSLGKQVLRVDTAAIAVVSYIKLNEEHLPKKPNN